MAPPAETVEVVGCMYDGGEGADDAMVYFAMVDDPRLMRPGGPGARPVMEVVLIRNRWGMGKLKKVGTGDGQVAVEAEVMCAIRGSTENQ